MKPGLIIAAVFSLFLAPLAVAQQTPPTLVAAYDALADTILSLHETEACYVRALLDGRFQAAKVLAAKGDWEAVHTIAQADTTEEGSWAHGIVHLMEGDLSNADYWYGKAGRQRPAPAAIDEEIAALKAAVSD